VRNGACHVTLEEIKKERKGGEWDGKNAKPLGVKGECVLPL
jgi:hypothetical protein